MNNEINKTTYINCHYLVLSQSVYNYGHDPSKASEGRMLEEILQSGDLWCQNTQLNNVHCICSLCMIHHANPNAALGWWSH